MTTLQNIISDIRIFMYGGMRTLPITIAGTMTILGLFTANYPMLFFLIGFLLLTPSISYIINEGCVYVINKMNWSWFNIKSTDLCKITIPYKTIDTNPNTFGPTNEPIASSTWIAMVSFFIGYIFTNGYELYIREPESVKNATDTSQTIEKTNNRKFRISLSMGSILLFAMISLGYRAYTGCENGLMVFFATLFGIFGYGWYKLLSTVGHDRLSDIFGIANRLLVPSATTNEPTVCVPS